MQNAGACLSREKNEKNEKKKKKKSQFVQHGGAHVDGRSRLYEFFFFF